MRKKEMGSHTDPPNVDDGGVFTEHVTVKNKTTTAKKKTKML